MREEAKTVGEVRQLMGIIGFYKGYISEFHEERNQFMTF